MARYVPLKPDNRIGLPAPWPNPALLWSLHRQPSSAVKHGADAPAGRTAR